MQGGADLQGSGNDLANAIFGNDGNNLIDGGARRRRDERVDFGDDVYFVDNPETT